VHVTTPGGILIFYGDTPGGMFFADSRTKDMGYADTLCNNMP